MEYGESLVQKFPDIKCEHNLIKIGSVLRGSLILTDFKVVFKPDPQKNNTSLTNNSTIVDDPNSQLTSNNILDFFSVPYGYIFSQEIKTVVQSSNKVKQSYVCIITKDHRTLNYILPTYENCVFMREQILRYSFPEKHPLMKIGSAQVKDAGGMLTRVGGSN